MSFFSRLFGDKPSRKGVVAGSAVAAGGIVGLITVSATQVVTPDTPTNTAWGWSWYETGDTPPSMTVLPGHPTEDNTGVPDGTVLTNYTGSCTITTPNTIINAKTINCPDFTINTTGVQITNSLINGAIRVGTQDPYPSTTPVSDPEGDDPIRLTIEDSEIDSGAADGLGFRPLGPSHYIARRVLIHNTTGFTSGAECHNACTIEDSFIRGFGEHVSGIRVLRNGTLRGNTIWCQPNPTSDDANDGFPWDVDGGCSANITMYQEFGTPDNNLIEDNYFPSVWSYYSLAFNGEDIGNIRILNNTFGPLAPHSESLARDWDVKPSNIWSGNTFLDGSVAPPE